MKEYKEKSLNCIDCGGKMLAKNSTKLRCATCLDKRKSEQRNARKREKYRQLKERREESKDVSV